MDAPSPERSPTILAVLVGRPAEHVAPNGRLVRTAFRKHLVEGPVAVGTTNLEGDEQADLRVHGGPDKAVLAYSADHAAAWRAVDPALAAPGAFGENLHVDVLTERDVCIGDQWSAGSVLFEVSQPRQPCWKVDDRWGRDDLVARIEASGRTGWYLRVLQEGVVQAGDRWALVARPHPEWTVARATEVRFHRTDDIAAARELVSLPELAASWQRALDARLQRAEEVGADGADASGRHLGTLD